MARRASRATKTTRPSSSGEAFGERLARIRKHRGFTQVELAERVGMIQVLISDYENGKLRPYADIAARFATALGVSTDELLGLESSKQTNGSVVSRRFLRRLQKIDSLPKRDQDALLRTIDAFLGKTG